MLSSASFSVDEAATQTIDVMTRRGTTNLFLSALFIQNIILLSVGSGPLSLLLLTVMEGTCYYLISRYGKIDINATIILSVAATHLVVASFIKIALLQSLDENLIVPELTESIVLTYFAALVGAFFVTRALPLPRTREKPEPNVKTLEYLTIISAVLMMLPLASPSDADINSTGPVNILGVATRGFAPVAMVSAITCALKKSDGRKIFDAGSITVLALSILLGLAGNSREGVLAPLLAVAITPIFQGYRFSAKMIGGALASLVFVSFFVSPALLLVRNDRTFLSFPERIEKTAETIGLLMIRDPATIGATERPLDEFRYTVWGRYFGQPVPFADRIGLIQTTDALAAASYGGNYVDIEGSFQEIVAGLFPNFVLDWFDIHIERTRTTGDKVTSSLGLTDATAASFLAIPLDAEAYAAGGIWSVAIQSFLSYMLIFYINRLAVGRRLTHEVLPIALLLLAYHICSEGDATSLLYFALRVLPQFIVSFYLVLMLARVLGATQTADAV